MRKVLLILPSLVLASGSAFGQAAFGAMKIAQPDMKGTARFMSMGGAFGALGGDLSTLSYNPAGIGVYRSSELGFTVDLDCQHSSAESQGLKTSLNHVNFLLNNIGGVATLRLGSSVVPNLNLGFTYNKSVSYNRRYKGTIPQLYNSMSNYIAGIANMEQVSVGDVTTTSSFNPYYPNDGKYEAPWLTILGYDTRLITPKGNPHYPYWRGQWGTETAGSGYFSAEESGSVGEYNIALGGNFINAIYWGMNFNIASINYNTSTMWGEALDDAYVGDDDVQFTRQTSDWRLMNQYSLSGSGFKYQFGVIIKPIQELRFGFAFHTPTWYSLNETYSAGVAYRYDNGSSYLNQTDDGNRATNNFNFSTPWRLMASVAGVLGSKVILSADYEWTPYYGMRFSQYQGNGYWNGGYDDWWNDPWYAPAAKTPAKIGNDFYSADMDSYYYSNRDIKDYFTSSHTLRLGAEYRVTPQFSVRAGYSFVSSPVKEDIKENRVEVATAGTRPEYVIDNSTNYITCGFGYKYQKFYVDMAYVFKHISADYHAYTSDPLSPDIPSPVSKLSLNNHQVVLSFGFRI